MDTGRLWKYSSNELITEPVSWNNVGNSLSRFDESLRESWDKAMNEGFFRYTLEDCRYKQLDLCCGSKLKVPCIAQLNCQRGFNRRKREEFNSMNDDFDENQFNFTKIKDNEILFETMRESDEERSSMQSVLLNISPIDYGHVLLVPNMNDCLPQRLTTESLLLAFDILQLSSQPSFRIGFNSLHAWASINHLHFHGMYCDYEIFGDVFPADEHIGGSCCLLNASSPLPAFVFSIPEPEDPADREKVAHNATIITNYLHSASVPYNVVLNRGKLLQSNGMQSTNWTSRVLIFPRNSSKGLDPSELFDIACVEVGGHFPVKTKEKFDSLTPEIARTTLEKAALEEGIFKTILCNVKKLLKS